MDKSYGRVKHIASNGRDMTKNDTEKQRRLAEALRANLKKRKMPSETPTNDESREGKDR
jgi:hypothetical protein